jgi:hypothetical protein
MENSHHWFFTQGQDALLQELYLPGVSALLKNARQRVEPWPKVVAGYRRGAG